MRKFLLIMAVVLLPLISFASTAEVVTGLYYAMAQSVDGYRPIWQIKLWQDEVDTGKYWIANLDPIAFDKGYTYNEGYNKVYGFKSADGSRIDVPVGQHITSDLQLKNYADKDFFSLEVSEEGVITSISGEWGSVMAAEDSGNVEPIEFSRYERTMSDFEWRYTDDEENHVATPVICVSEDHTVTMHCETEDAVILYNLNGCRPAFSSIPYYQPLKITENCIIKAFAEKNGYTSEMASYIVDDFICETPSSDPLAVTISDNQAGELASHITDSQKETCTKWTVSGKINGSDIAFLREVIALGKMTDLDLSSADIVSGGSPYYEIADVKLRSEDFVVGKWMFRNARCLESLKLPNSTRLIEENAIDSCLSLKTIAIPDDCFRVEKFAIQRCPELKSIHIGKTVTDFGYGNGYDCNNLRWITVDTLSENYTSSDGILYSADMTKLYKCPQAFPGNEFTVPESVTILGQYAFAYCNFKYVNLPSGLNQIRTGAFKNCRKLKNFDFPQGVTYIDWFVFENCISFTHVSIPDHVTYVDFYSFEGCKNLETVHLGLGMSYVDITSFADCPSLTAFTVDENNTSLFARDGVLYHRIPQKVIMCPQALTAEELIVCEGTETIDTHAFENCAYIKNIVLPEGLASIEDSAFRDCKMESITIPNTVSTIDGWAFSRCNKLKSFSIPDSLMKVDAILKGCSKLSYLYIPKGIKEISMFAFSDCESMTIVDSWIEDISAVEVGSEIFPDSPFEGWPADCTWHIPVGCADAYRSQQWWVATWNIIDDLIPSSVEMADDDTVRISVSNGSLIVESGMDIVIPIYNVAGALVTSVDVPGGQTAVVELPAGVYIINGRKILVN